MKREFFKGDIKDVCAELKAEAERCAGMKVGEWLKFRKFEQKVAKNLGIDVKELRYGKKL